MRPDIYLHQIVLEYALGDQPPPVRKFLQDFAGSDAQSALIEFLRLVTSPGAPTTLYVANINLHEAPADFHLDLLLRPPCEGPRAHEFARGGHTLALSTFRRKGKLVVSRLEVTPHVPLRAFEARVCAPVIWSRGEHYMSADDLAALGGLPPHRLVTRRRLAPWRQYLEWKEDLIRRSQISIPYLRYRWINDTCLAFLVRAADLPQRSVAQVEFDATIPAPPDLEQDPDVELFDADRPRRGRQPRPPEPIRLGSVDAHRRVDPRDQEHVQWWGKALEGPGFAQVVIRLDEDQAGKLARQKLPAPGQQLSSIAGELRPLRLQAEAIERLQTSRGFCPRLVDFLFDARNASVVQLAAELPPVDGGRDLNPGQRDAVLKALSAPDLCLIQGPPGTGKTTVIADICLRVALAGGRVLVASQTNLAVDNALARLADRPAIRRLRLGAPDRVDEEFKDFLADNVIPRWFSTIADQCLGRMEAADALRAAQQERDRLLTDLRAAHAAHARAAEHLGRSQERSHGLEHQDAAAENQLARLREAAEAARRREAADRALAAWSAGAAGFPAELPQDHAVGDLSVAKLRELTLAATAREPLIKLAAFLDVLRLDDPLTETSPEVADLRRRRAQLSESDRDEDLAELKQINRHLKKLEQEGWSKIGRQLRLAAAGVFPGDLPDCLLRLVDALKPEPALAASLREARDLVRARVHAAESARTTIADLVTPLSERARESAERHRAARAALDRHERELVDLRRRIADARDEFDVARGALDDATRMWEAAHRQLAPDDTAPPVSANALQRAAERVAEADAADAGRLQHAARWRGVQAEWLARLQRITESDREHLRGLYVRHANVVGMTCNEAGKREQWQRPDFEPFDVVIVDEVSKATPTELLMPMLLGERVILVGDHRQLPPMFRENKDSFADAIDAGELSAEDFQRYRKMVTASLFEELYEQAPAEIKATLWTQYRMHPQVMFAVNQFYEGRLEAGPDESSLDRARQHHLEIADRQGGRLLEPGQHLLWIDSSQYRETKRTEEQRGSSKANLLEVELVLATLEFLAGALAGRGYLGVRERDLEGADRDLRGLVEHILPAARRETLAELFAEGRVRLDGRRQRPDAIARAGARLRVDARKEIGVLTFYGAQLQDIRAAIDRRKAAVPGIFDPLDLRTNTVDRFQGMEKSIVIASLVRATQGTLGQFVREYQRINVGLSRAQQLLVIIGAADTWKRARVPLPPLAGGPDEEVAVYANIFQLASQYGGRRLARQLLG